jgi:hypothetical protein
MTPKTRNILIGVVAALATALTAYLQGCTPAQIAHVESATDRTFAQLDCAKRALEAHDDALVDPDLGDLPGAADLALALRNCLKPAPAPTADAGAK